jgi:hypothetical protein
MLIFNYFSNYVRIFIPITFEDIDYYWKFISEFKLIQVARTSKTPVTCTYFPKQKPN